MKKMLSSLLAVILFCGTAISAAAAGNGAEELSWGGMLMGSLGGLALFLFGMERMTDALKAAAGKRLQTVLARLTSNRFSGALVGALVTAVIQSSSVTTVLVVGFVSSGLMSLSQSIGVILGANIGSTITAQIIAFKVSRFALLFVAVGFAAMALSRKEYVRHYGGMMFGLGLVFFGMAIMSDSMTPLRDYQPFLDLMVGMRNPLLGILVGALFTALIQSSAATTGIVIVLASQGFMSLNGGIAIALGANIGTCVTALLASIGKPRPAIRAAAVHVLFNLVGVLLWVGFIDHLATMAVAFSPHYPDSEGLARLAAESPRQIANANTLFNLVNTLLFIGFTPFLGRLVVWLFPDRPEHLERSIATPKFLDEQLLDTPSAALNLVRLEVGQLGEHVLQMMSMTQTALDRQSEDLFREIEKSDDAADILHAAIIEYLNKIGKRPLTEELSLEYFRLVQSVGTLESIGDLIETDLSRAGLDIARHQLAPSETMQDCLRRLQSWVFSALESAVRAVVDNDQSAAQDVLALRKTVNEVVENAFRKQATSLARSEHGHLETLQIEFELTNKLKQIYSLCKRIARLYVPREVV